jgi:hypothetical protein
MSVSIPLSEKSYESRCGLRPSEKELPERRSGEFRHKNTPSYDPFHLLTEYSFTCIASEKLYLCILFPVFST